MNILYVHQYFRTPEEGGCVRSYHLAKSMVESGHSVTMVTAHNLKSEPENIDGINIHYLRIPYQNHFGFLRRIIAFITYVIRSKSLIKRINQSFDLAYVMTTPLTTGMIALHMKSKYDTPFYFEVGDLWPEAPIQMGAIKNPLLKNVLYRFEKRCYREAKKVIALSPDISNYVKQVSPKTHTEVVTNFSDLDLFEFNHELQAFDADNPLKVCYIGTFGDANHLEYLIAAARSCEEANLPIRFKLMGSGKRFDQIKALSHNLRNTTIQASGNLITVKKELESAHISYVSFLNVDVLSTGSPNKFFDGLAVGNAIVLNFGGWLKDIVEQKQVGFYHDPTKPEHFVSQIKKLIQAPEILFEYQKNSRNLAERIYSKGLQSRKLNEILIRKEISDS